MKKRIILSLLCFMLGVSMLGCGEKESLDEYKLQMEQFFESAAAYDDAINGIDYGADDYSVNLLEQLDGLDVLFSEMAQIEVPEEFEGIEELADEASENMSSAVALYHQAYETESYRSNVADSAKQYYDRANLRISYILMILHGEVPDQEAFSAPEDYSEE